MSHSAASPASAAGPTAAARAVQSAGLLAVRARPTGDAVAAAGVLARAARRFDTPFHLRVTREPTVGADARAVLVGYADDPTARSDASSHDGPTDTDRTDTDRTDTDRTDTDRTDDPIRVPADEASCTRRVAAALREAGIEPAPLLALAGAVASGAEPAGESLATAERADRVERRLGLALPTDDPAVGLAYTTRLRHPDSGDPEAARETLADIGLGDVTDVGSSAGVAETASASDTATASDETDLDRRRRLASAVALRATTDAPASAVQATERVLHPHATDGPFGSVEAYADVLSTLAVADPGLASAAVVDPAAVAEPARDRWRDHGERVHAALDAARTARYDGVFVCRIGDAAAVGCGESLPATDTYGVLPSVAATALAFHAPEPRALVVTDAHAATVGSADAPVGEPLRTAAAAADGTATGRIRGVARFDGDVQAFLGGFREAIRP